MTNIIGTKWVKNLYQQNLNFDQQVDSNQKYQAIKIIFRVIFADFKTTFKHYLKQTLTYFSLEVESNVSHLLNKLSRNRKKINKVHIF